MLPLATYARSQMPDGSTRVVGSTDATRGCKHLCRHCPIVPVYKGRFHAIPVDAVLDGHPAQVARGRAAHQLRRSGFSQRPDARAAHRRTARERNFPGVTYDVTIKIEHLLKHASMLPVLAQTGCLFVTSAVESIDDEVLRHLAKGHTRADFVRGRSACAATRASTLIADVRRLHPVDDARGLRRAAADDRGARD